MEVTFPHLAAVFPPSGAGTPSGYVPSRGGNAAVRALREGEAMAEFVTQRQHGPTEVTPRDSASAGTPEWAEPLDGAEATGLLDRARAFVDPELRTAVESWPGSMRRIARYHLGWEDADGTPATAGTREADGTILVAGTPPEGLV